MIHSKRIIIVNKQMKSTDLHCVVLWSRVTPISNLEKNVSMPDTTKIMMLESEKFRKHSDLHKSEIYWIVCLFLQTSDNMCYEIPKKTVYFIVIPLWNSTTVPISRQTSSHWSLWRNLTVLLFSLQKDFWQQWRKGASMMGELGSTEIQHKDWPWLLEHCLIVSFRIQFKISLLVLKAFNRLAPPYLSELLHHHAAVRALRSTKQMLLQPSRSKQRWQSLCSCCSKPVYFISELLRKFEIIA